MTLEAFLFIANIHTFLMALGFVMALIRFKRREPAMKLFAMVFFLSVLANESAFILHDFSINVNYSSSIYAITIGPVLSLLYFFAFKKEYGKTFIAVNIAYVSFAVINLIFIQQSAPNSYSYIALSIILMSYCISYFYWLIVGLPASNLLRLPMFWVNTGFLIYYSGNFFLFVFTAYLVNVLNNNLMLYGTMHNVLGMIQTVIAIFALFVELKNIKSEDLKSRMDKQFGQAIRKF